MKLNKMSFKRFTHFLLIIFTLITASHASEAQVLDYPLLSSKPYGTANPLSPDPLINYKWPAPKATDGLERYELLPVDVNTTDKASFVTKNFKANHLISVRGKGSIRFDFGRVSAGWLEFESDDVPDSISLSVSEYNEPAVVNAGAVNPVKTKTPVKHGNTYRLELNPELYEGVRFGWLHVITHRKTWLLKNIRLVCQVKPVNYKGSFACSDPELTRIWYTGAYTVKLNLQKDYFGAILMERSDRHSWTGDAYPAQAASMVAFGNYDFVKANLINTSSLNNGVASYSLYWVLSLIDYVNYTGDKNFALKYIDNARQKLEVAYEHFGKQPGLGFYGWDEHLGAGFENPNIAESQYAYSMLSIRAWQEFSKMMMQIGNRELSNKYKAYAEDKMQVIRKEGNWLRVYGIHAAADAINTGLSTAKEITALYNQRFTDRVNRLSYSPFNQYSILNAMSTSGHYKEALSMISDYWGGQINQGATTFYEVYRPSWNAVIGKYGAPPNNQCGYTSLTHPWSAGVTKWISEEVLGIKPIDPGFERFEIVPHSGNALNWIAGSIYTPKGLISTSFNIAAGIATVSVPNGTKAAKVAIPLGENVVGLIMLNGKQIKNYIISDLHENGQYAILNELNPGTYAINITYSKKIASKPVLAQKWNYLIQKFDQDSLTGGNWRSRYGKDGYVLFNQQKSGENTQQLPAYISGIILKNQANLYKDAPEKDRSLLTDAAGKPGGFGAVITQDPNPTAQTITIDLTVIDNGAHQVALYFLDWDNQNRRSAVELFDMNTLDLLSPVQLIRTYTKGKYLIFNYRGSTRIRINQVRGKNAALSGLFFDPKN